MIDKREAVTFLLERSEIVYLMVDARADGVVLPPGVAEQYNYVVAISVMGLSALRDIDALNINIDGLHMIVDDQMTSIPWKSIYQAVARNEAQFLWLDDAPKPLPPDVDKPLRGGLRAV